MNVRTLRPMLLSRGEVPLASSEWSYEIKWDGMRVLVGGGRIVSRHGTDCTSWYPELRTALEHLPPHSIFDGEVVSFVEGRPSFSTLQRRIMARGSREQARLSQSEPVTLVLFDVLQLDGECVTGLPWYARRERLEWSHAPAPGLEITPSQADGDELWRAVQRLGLEGIVAKRRSSMYRPGERTAAWVKLKTTYYSECVVGGWVETQGGGIAALVVGQVEGGGLHYRAHVAFGMLDRDRSLLAELLPRLEVAESPFVNRPPRSGSWAQDVKLGPVHWLAPVVRIRVRHHAGTGSGLLRDAVFEALTAAPSRRLGVVR